MAESLIVTTSVLALISTSASLGVTLSKLYRNVRGAPEKLQRLFREIAVLRDVVDECHEVLDRSEAPRYVRESMISCFELGEEVVRVAQIVSRGVEGNGRQKYMAAIRLALRDDE